jgi:predicted glycosyltransferase
MEETKARRSQLLLELFQRERPDLFLIELYPFGRKKFRFELDPIIEAIGTNAISNCRVVCSLRDILVERPDRVKFEARVVATLNNGFDALLVHADPNLVRLEDTFSRMAEIRIPVIYTGFVTPKPSPGARERLHGRLRLNAQEPLVVVSAGGGKVAGSMLEAAMGALLDLSLQGSLRGILFCGPYLDDDVYRRLKTRATGQVQVERFSDDFLGYLAAADLSISMAGYNTCMNILAAGVTALVWPFAHGEEQRRRAAILSKVGRMRVLENSDLNPVDLAAIIQQSLMRSRDWHARARVDLDGAGATARWIREELFAPKAVAYKVGPADGKTGVGGGN